MLEEKQNEKIQAPDMVSAPTAVKDEVVAKLVAMGFTTRSISCHHYLMLSLIYIFLSYNAAYIIIRI